MSHDPFAMWNGTATSPEHVDCDSDQDAMDIGQFIYSRASLLHVRQLTSPCYKVGLGPTGLRLSRRQSLTAQQSARAPGVIGQRYVHSSVVSPDLTSRAMGWNSSSSSSATVGPLGSMEIGNRPKRPQSHKAELTRGVQQLLNVVSPENLNRIVERFKGIVIQGPEDLELMISLVIRKVLDEPHYCETYADLVCSLGSRYSEFPPETEGGRPTTFARVLIHAVQNEWEDHKKGVLEMEGDHIPFADVCEQQEQQRRRALANMKFIGHLFLRKLLAQKVMNFVLIELLSGAEEHMVECACQLMQVIGHALDATLSGTVLLLSTLARLVNLRDAVNADGRATLSKRVRYKIEDLLDLQRRGWQEKVLREQAKTIEEVRRDAEEELRRVGRGAQMRGGSQAAQLTPRPVAAAASSLASARDVDALGRCVVGSAVAHEHRDTARLPTVDQKSQADADGEVAACRSLLEIGAGSGTEQLQSMCAEAVIALVTAGALSRAVLGFVLAPMLNDLRFLKDASNANRFLEQLLAKLLVASDGPESDVALVKALLDPDRFSLEGNTHVWTLLMGTLQRVKAFGGLELVQRIISRRQVSAALRATGQCSRRQLARILESQGFAPKLSQPDQREVVD